MANGPSSPLVRRVLVMTDDDVDATRPSCWQHGQPRPPAMRSSQNHFLNHCTEREFYHGGHTFRDCRGNSNKYDLKIRTGDHKSSRNDPMLPSPLPEKPQQNSHSRQNGFPIAQLKMSFMMTMRSWFLVTTPFISMPQWHRRHCCD